MMATTHTAFSLTLTSLALGTANPVALLIAAVASQFPDVDTSKSTVGRFLLPISRKRDSELTIDRELAKIYADLGVIYIRKEDFKKGARYFDKALKQEPDDLTVRSNLAETYFKMGLLEKSRGLLEKAASGYRKILSIAPGHVESQIGLGEVYVAMGDTDDPDIYRQAIKHFTEGINQANPMTGSKRLNNRELAADTLGDMRE